MKNTSLNRILKFTFSFTIFLLITNFFFAKLANARPGGGSSFGGGGGGGSSFSGGGSSFGGGGGGGGDFSWENVLMIIIFLVISFVIGKIKENRRKKQIISNPTYDNRVAMNRHKEVEDFKATDSNFSKTLFIDFTNSLFNKYYAQYNSKEFSNLSPFFSEQEMKKQAELLPNSTRVISEIVIGSTTISMLKSTGGGAVAAVDFEANFTLTSSGKRTRYAVTERWHLTRAQGVISAEPQKMRELSCPNCGAPASFTDAGECQSCTTKIVAGTMQWAVVSQHVMKQNIYKTSGLTHYSEEVGTNYKTIKSHSLETNSNHISNLHGVAFSTWETDFRTKVVSHYFLEIYAAWSLNDLSPVRAMLSDRLYDSFMFWIDEYKSQGLTNILSDLLISKIEIVSIDIDKFYETVTIRVFASAKDYVQTIDGTFAGGSSAKPRVFSEYWTFVRSRNAKDTFDTSTCPNCGAAADKMGQAGICEYCNTKISNGDFSWVLSVITQDEVYIG